jgi:DME family drug/metabolite transporter
MALFSSATRRDRAGMLLIALGATTWGTIGIVVSLLYRFANTDASSIGFLRLAIATPALLLLSRLLVGRSFIAVARRDLAVMLVIGAAFAAYQVFYFAAISYIGVAVAVLINICSAPIFIALLAWLFLNERLSIIVMLALLTALGGTVLLVGVPQPDTAAVSLLGAALALGAGLAYAVIAVSCRAIAARYHPVQPIAVAFALGTLLLMPFAISRGLVVATTFGMDVAGVSWPCANGTWLCLVSMGAAHYDGHDRCYPHAARTADLDGSSSVPRRTA